MPLEVLDNSLKVANVSLDAVLAIMEMLKKEEENRGAQEIAEHYDKEGKCDAWTCDASVAKDFDRKLSEEGIAHACVQYSGDQKRNTVYVIAKNEDRDRIKEVRDRVLKERSMISKVSLDELKRQNVDGDIHTINGVSQTYAKVFEEQAKSAGFIMAVSDNKDGTYNVHYSGKDKVKAEPALMRTIESTRGETGRLNELRISREMELNETLYKSIPDAQKDFYVVSATRPNEYMHFNSEGYQYYRNERLVEDKLRSDTSFQQDAHKKVNAAFITPMILSRDEYERVKGLSAEEFRKEISRKHITRTTHHQDHQLELERMARQLAEFKMSLDNNELNTDVYNTAVTFNAFYNREIITDKQIDREEEMSISNPKSLPPDIEATIDKFEELPKEDKEYVKQNVREYFQELRETETKIEVEEITHEDLRDDLDAVIEGVSTTTTTREEKEEEVEREI